MQQKMKDARTSMPARRRCLQLQYVNEVSHWLARHSEVNTKIIFDLHTDHCNALTRFSRYNSLECLTIRIVLIERESERWVAGGEGEGEGEGGGRGRSKNGLGWLKCINQGCEVQLSLCIDDCIYSPATGDIESLYAYIVTLHTYNEYMCKCRKTN
jgi:hypothetical protein